MTTATTSKTTCFINPSQRADCFPCFSYTDRNLGQYSLTVDFYFMFVICSRFPAVDRPENVKLLICAIASRLSVTYIVHCVNNNNSACNAII